MILSIPEYEMIEDDYVYLKFFNKESEYNKNVKFKISYGMGENNDEVVYSDWDKLNENIFKIEKQDKYFIKIVAILPNKNVTESPEKMFFHGGQNLF